MASPAGTQNLNQCFCGNRFPYMFTEKWEKVLRDGQTYALCKKNNCGKLLEAFYHGTDFYWIWPINSELS